MTPIWCEIVCARCASTVSGRFTRRNIDRASMRRTAHASGWVVRDNDWLCRSCADKQTDTDMLAKMESR